MGRRVGDPAGTGEGGEGVRGPLDPRPGTGLQRLQLPGQEAYPRTGRGGGVARVTLDSGHNRNR